MDSKKLAPRTIITIVMTIIFFAFQMYLALIKQLPPMLQSPLHLVFALTVIYLYNPADKKYRKNLKMKKEKEGTVPTEEELNAREYLNFLDIPVFVGIAFLFYYVVTQYKILLDHVAFIDPVRPIDIACMLVTLLLLLEAVRRTLGNILLVFILIFVAYAWLAPYCPGIFYTKGKGFTAVLRQFTEGMTMGEAGVFGTPLYTSASSLFYFIVFGVFFSECGGGQLLIDIGMKFSNKSSGGPAKAAVISSGLMGMISGSAVVNVSTTGVMTIPMMKKIGYKPEQAGAIEAVASTGGQIMPPIMGVGAFIMAEMLGVSYFTVAKAAVLPAFAYYFAVFVLVTYMAKKSDVNSNAASAAIEVKQKIIPRLYLLLPAILLVIWIIRGASLMRSGMVGIFSCLACNLVSYFVNKKENFLDLRGLGDCCLQGVKQAAEIAIPTGACGIIINVVTGQTSLATNLTKVVGTMGGSYLFAALLIAMLGCMLLGMALPTVAAYLVGVILFVPVIRSLGVSPLCANMFVFYYGIMAQITPPVCLASYTAAGIAGADPMKTGLTGMLYALVGFLVPLVFIYNPAVLLEGTMAEIIFGGAQLLAGTFLLAITVAGYFKANLSKAERIMILVAAFLLITPETITSIVGVVIGVAGLVMNTTKSKQSIARTV